MESQDPAMTKMKKTSQNQTKQIDEQRLPLRDRSLKDRIRRRYNRMKPGLQVVLSRGLDLLVGLALLAVTWPFMLVRGVIAAFQTGRIFSRADRLGIQGEPFTLFMFAGDFYGRRLASLFNLIGGSVSLAGPRALSAREARNTGVDPVLLSVKPGLFSAYSLRKKLNLAYESETEIDRDYVHQSSASSGLTLTIRSVLSGLFASNSNYVSPDNFKLLGLTLRNTEMDEALDWVFQRARGDRPATMSFVNADCLNLAFIHADYREILQQSDRVLPDGIGIHVACRMKKLRLRANLNGTDMFPRLCQRAAENGTSIYLLGARPEIAQAAAEAMVARYPGLVIAGTHHGYFNEEQSSDIISDINNSGADILCVAMGAPHQERWLARHAGELNPPLRMGVGGLFDYYSGRVRRAPQWVREIGMEWVWRIAMEPRRLWKRYVVGNPLFLYRAYRYNDPDLLTPEIVQSALERNRAGRKVSAAAKRIFRRVFYATGAAIKRTMDFMAAAVAILLLSPFLLLLCLAIKLESPGGIFFNQTRIGAGGEPFKMWKFRSMYQDAEARKAALMAQNEMQGGVIFKMKDDPRITRIGKFIRRASIDELPQLWNVLIGDMSLVGPRPPVPSEVAEYTLSDRRRLHVKPGITCIWQVSGRSTIPFDQQVELDVDYMHTQSVWTDIKLLLKTLPAVFKGTGAY